MTEYLKLTGLSLLAAALGVIAGAHSPRADIGDVLAGSHVGVLNRDKEIHLLVRTIPERKGSFLGLMLMKDRAAQFYRIDPLDSSLSQSYAMNPIEVGRDGELGVLNIEPSLVLSLGRICPRTGRPDFTINDAGSRNSAGFQGSIVFKAGHNSDLSWSDYVPGEFKGNHDRLRLSALTDHEATLFSEQAGSFVIREKMTGIYSIKKLSVTSAGALLETRPYRIGAFILDQGLFGSRERLIWISPSNFRDVTHFNLKR
ncbi:MAG: hypothetical protein A2428_07700 [Bdellovibrionales bacterium RIFOXYC1_FULL_54_43]|nr:MAG: hypothetical protein A2428_07700 [Bdellovibrionales bacterium RIFOXYC1_FULL_54_43]OFZ79518.1 MAG: hypothetical protein A2603_09925 [Bdellovibrionales bacterium RIFOXYD1_FULL_55_31]